MPSNIPDELYQRILRAMPIPCVDLLVRHATHDVLLIKRRNSPARGHWWMPGGRVHFGESRADAARRKLAQECDILATSVREVGTYDLFLDDGATHAITTVFEMTAPTRDVRLDAQSDDFAWRGAAAWLTEPLHPFLRLILEKAT